MNRDRNTKFLIQRILKLIRIRMQIICYPIVLDMVTSLQKMRLKYKTGPIITFMIYKDWII